MITEEQRSARKNFIGSSDAAAVVGCDPFKTAADVYYEKTHETEAWDGNAATEIGNLLENIILDWGASKLGIEIKKSERFIHSNGFMLSHPDGVGVSEPVILEGKTAGIITPFDRNKWGEVETNEIPENYLVQCQHHLACAGPEYKVCHVPVLLGGVGLRMYHVERDEDFISMMENIEAKFWNENVLKLVPPEDATPSLELMRRIKRMPNKTIKIESSLISNWEEAKAVLKEAEKRKSEAEAILLAALGDAEAADCERGTLTYLEQTRKACQAKASTFRVPRFKEARHG